jgi:hypothetical protein
LKNIERLPTPYSDVNEVLYSLLQDVQAVLSAFFVGMYLYGSLAAGDFDTRQSDIDFLVVTHEELPKRLISDLKIMHSRLYASGPEWWTKMSGAYVPIGAMRKYSPTGPECPLINKEEFLVARPDIDWVIHRHILYTSGVVITGPPLQTMIDPVQPKQLREAALTLLRNNWIPLLDNTNIFLGIGHQPFIVLTMCRALYTLEHGIAASKKISAEWAITALDGKWTELIKQAAAWHYGQAPGDIHQTQEFMRYTIKRAGI